MRRTGYLGNLEREGGLPTKAPVALPRALRAGDWLAFDAMGAYTVCAASRFNGFDVSQVVYTAGAGPAAGETRRVLRAYAGAAAALSAGGAGA